MNAFAKVDKATFLRFAAAHPRARYEYVGGRIVQQMMGGALAHGLITRRITRQIEDQLDPAKWVVVNERGVETPVTIRYPEVVVEPVGDAPASLSTLSPMVIVEVLSPSTTATDLDVKPSEYLSLSSLDAYVVASQDEAAVLVYERGADGFFADEPREVCGPDTLAIQGRHFTIRLDLAEIYHGIA